MKDYHINVFFSDEDGGYIADIPDLKYCSAFGRTPDEAVREVLIAKKVWIKTALKEGVPVPPPKYCYVPPKEKKTGLKNKVKSQKKIK